jgi:hypothetical protein
MATGRDGTEVSNDGAGIDALIASRHRQRVREEGNARPAEEAWQKATRARAQATQRELAKQWYQFHREMAKKSRNTGESLARNHEAEALRFVWAVDAGEDGHEGTLEAV